jgi:hypothetical protein
VTIFAGATDTPARPALQDRAQNFGNVPSPAASVTQHARVGLLQVVMPLRHQGRLAEARASVSRKSFLSPAACSLPIRRWRIVVPLPRRGGTIFGKIREGRLIAS